MVNSRPDWQETWGQFALTMAQRSRCDRAKIGAVIVSPDNRVIDTGYNGPPAHWRPPGGTVTDHCVDFCIRGRRGPENLPPEQLYDDCPSNHAEINALMHSERSEREGGTIYVTGSVCYTCAKAIANSGLAAVGLVNVDEKTEAYRNPEKVRLFLQDCGLEVFHVRVSTQEDPPPCPRCGEPMHPIYVGMHEGDDEWVWGHDCEPPLPRSA